MPPVTSVPAGAPMAWRAPAEAVRLTQPEDAADEKSAGLKPGRQRPEEALGGADRGTPVAVEHHVAVEHGQQAVPQGQEERLRGDCERLAGGGHHAARRREGEGEGAGRDQGGDDDLMQGRGPLLGARGAGDLVRGQGPLADAVPAGGDVAERAAAVGHDEAAGRSRHRPGDLPGQAVDHLAAGGLLPGLVGDQAAAELEEEDVHS